MFDARRILLGVLSIACLTLTGCQFQSISALALQVHQSRVDGSGLEPPMTQDSLDITCALPPGWDQMHPEKNLLYSHRQWRSPDRHAGFGVAYFRTPIPLSASTIIWLAKNQYVKNESEDNSGRLIGQWTDTLGRSWFEAENSLYHVKGYAMTHGFDAWIVYSGYRVRTPPPPTQIDLAERAANSVAPITAEVH